MAFLLIETDSPQRTSVVCDDADGPAKIRVHATGSAWNVALAILKCLTPDEVNELKLIHAGKIQRQTARQIEAAKIAAAEAGCVLSEPPPPESVDVLAEDAPSDGVPNAAHGH